MENLNVELTQILETIGYEEQKLDYIKKHPKVYPGPATRPDSDKWEKYYDSELREEIRGRERVIFNLFPDYANE